VSARTFSARFESKSENTTIIQTFVPTNRTEEEVKKDFFRQLQTAFNKRMVRDLIMVIGDPNVKLGSNNRNWKASLGSDQ